MNSNSQNGGLSDRPELAERIARIVIPILHRILPFGAYRIANDLFCSSYARSRIRLESHSSTFRMLRLFRP